MFIIRHGREQGPLGRGSFVYNAVTMRDILSVYNYFGICNVHYRIGVRGSFGFRAVEMGFILTACDYFLSGTNIVCITCCLFHVINVAIPTWRASDCAFKSYVLARAVSSKLDEHVSWWANYPTRWGCATLHRQISARVLKLIHLWM